MIFTAVFAPSYLIITIGKSATVSFECLNCIATVKNKSVIIGIIYRPPPTNANGFSNTAFFNEWEDYLNDLMLLKHEILLTGDINFHLDCKTSSRYQTISFNPGLV